MVKFYSNIPHFSLGVRQLPGYPITSLKVSNTVIDFNGAGEYVTDNPLEIKCLRAYIKYYGACCMVWEDGAEPIPVIEPVEVIEQVKPVKVEEEPVSAEEQYAEFLKVLKRY